ncbi:hypothetical protein EIN_182380 [Entamoeba invadens IP1]|uniref:hypothetical protein n=1 Tax=Entamoeba invadens IP1 TaxID=370355 RepID=UPI0002C3E0CD|nr:hypothetical protein EIN_182380 [Entamoeba invadens IP1]ELP94011.1 hypothetical protein EIN_182380 [Entamoeba invadens IP1]|eukprot:XP_004260782.1 hypothetical protein EIN_182380 [Entamoeba invadens IP1]
MRASIADASGTEWITMFDEVMVGLLGKTADEMADLNDSNIDEFDKIFKEKQYVLYRMHLHGKKETYEGVDRLRFTANFVTPLYPSTSDLTDSKQRDDLEKALERMSGDMKDVILGAH